jgi:hypothetical protein
MHARASLCHARLPVHLTTNNPPSLYNQLCMPASTTTTTSAYVAEPDPVVSTLSPCTTSNATCYSPRARESMCMHCSRTLCEPSTIIAFCDPSEHELESVVVHAPHPPPRACTAATRSTTIQAATGPFLSSFQKHFFPPGRQQKVDDTSP